MRAPLLLLVPLVLAGCGEAIFGHCGPSDTVFWRDPALYEALAPADGVEARMDPVLARMPTAPGGLLAAIQWDGGSRGHDSPWVQLNATSLSAHATTEEHARETLTRFLENVSGDPERDAALVEAALANRSVAAQMLAGEGAPSTIYEYRVATTGPWELRDILQDSTGGDEAAHATGTLIMRSGPYRLVVVYPVREAVVGGIPIRVDLSGQAEAQVGDREGGSSAASIAKLDAALRAEGLPPTRDAQVRTLVC